MDASGNRPRPDAGRIGTLTSLPLSDLGEFPLPEITRAADLRFDPKALLPPHDGPATLLVSAQDARVTGFVTLGKQVFRGAGEILQAKTGPVLRFSSLAAGPDKLGSLSFTLPWTSGRADGVFACGLGGGTLNAMWWWQDPLTKECGNLISAQVIECSDPEGGNKSKFRYYHYERCDFVVWLDAQDQPILPPVRLTNDGPNGAPYTRGGVTITPLSQPLASRPVGANEKRSGQLRIFYVTGCKDARIVQYVRSTKTFAPPASDPTATMPANVTADWHRDGGDPYAGAQVNANGHTISSDIPAAYESAVADANDVKTIPAGATVTYGWTLETFIYCEGKLLAWVTWGGRVTFTKGNDGKLTPGAPSVDVPVFHGPGEFSQSAGNPPP